MKLKILYLFPHHLNIYGDRGNILTLKYRAKKRDIDVEIIEINSRKDKIPDDVNLIFGGGGQDKEQEYVSRELQFFKEKIHELIFQKKVPTLTICGTYQLFCRYFQTFDGKKIQGISVFDAITVASTKRKIGNVVVKVAPPLNFSGKKYSDFLVGFENHSGNTFIKTRKPENPNDKQFPNSNFKFPNNENIRKNLLEIRINPLGKVIKGFGNNGEDKTEGAIVENCIGTYLHGPILPKNPRLADWLIEKALQVGGQTRRSVPTNNNIVGDDLRVVPHLDPIDDSLELTTHEKVIEKFIR